MASRNRIISDSDSDLEEICSQPTCYENVPEDSKYKFMIINKDGGLIKFSYTVKEGGGLPYNVELKGLCSQ